jgi:hypothetical protein
MTDSVVHDPRAASLALLDGLIRRGRELAGRFTQNTQSQVFSASSSSSALHVDHTAEVRIWQYDCAAAINELSGGSKAHWLSRAYSNALLVRSTDGDAVVEADVTDIVRRVLDVLDQGRQSVAGMDAARPPSADVQEPHRFDFVHDPELRPVLEQAFADGRRAFEDGDYERALMTSCGIIEAIITDALRLARPELVEGRARSGQAEDRPISDWSFDERIAAAEQGRLIRGGCARLPAVARAYRDANRAATVSERDAATTRQVLRVVMRDLDPGR